MGDIPLNNKRRILLVGGGHSNIQVLKNLSLQLSPKENAELYLISDNEKAYYSGMLPGCVAKLYQQNQIWINLPELTEWCKATWIKGKMVGLDKHKKEVILEDGRRISYNILSMNIGSTTSGSVIEGVKEFSLSTRPISELLNKVEEWESQHKNFEQDPKVIVVGGGVSGYELCFGFLERLKHYTGKVDCSIIDHNLNPLEDMGLSFSNNVKKAVEERKIRRISNQSCIKIGKNKIVLSNNEELYFDLLVWATGASPHKVLGELGLSLCEKGFMLVNTMLQSLDDPTIFGGGDCITIKGKEWVPKAGVYAVREGPVITQNILSFLKGSKLEVYEPQKSFLSLLMTGDQRAISRYKFTSFYNGLVWILKDKIDRGFIDLFDVNKIGKSVAKY